MINTMYQEKSGEFVKKFAELTVQVHVDKKGKRKVGKIKIDLAEYISGGSMRFFQLTDCVDRKASICLSIKFTPIGETAIVETMSETSGHSGISMGTEGDYSGPLFNEQDLEAEEEEKEKPKHSSSYLALPKPKHSPAKRKASIANVDNLAMLKILQKENEQLKREKEEFKTQINLISERTKCERDEYIKYVGEMELSLKNTENKLKKYKEKSRKYKESLKSTQGELNEISGEFDEYKLQFNLQDRRKWKENLKEVQKNLQGAREENDKFKIVNDNLAAENRELSESNERLKLTNIKLLKDAEDSREQFHENTEEGSINSKMQKNLVKLKRDLKSSQEEVEELQSKQTEFIATIHSLKMAFANKEEDYKSKIRKLENDLLEKIQEIQDLNFRLEEEFTTSKKLERKTLTVQEDSDTKFSKLAKKLQEMSAEKEILEQNYLSILRKIDREKTSADFTSLAKAEATIATQKSEITKFQSQIKAQDTKIAEFKLLNEKLFLENSQLQDQIKKVNISKYSDPALVILQEKVKVLEEKIHENELMAAEEREKLSENNRVLEKQLEIVEEQSRLKLEEYEKKMNELLQENKRVTDTDKSKKSMVPGQLLSNMNEENWRQDIEMLNLKLLEYKNENEKLVEEVKVVESKYQESKLIISKKELEKENIQNKYREAQDQMREYSSQFTMLEVELYKINERFGQALNMNNQLENELQELKEQIYNSKYGRKKK